MTNNHSTYQNKNKQNECIKFCTKQIAQNTKQRSKRCPQASIIIKVSAECRRPSPPEQVQSLISSIIDGCLNIRLIRPSTRFILSSPSATCSPRFTSHLMSPVLQGQPDTLAPKLNVAIQRGGI